MKAFSTLKSWFVTERPGQEAERLYNALVAEARQPHWYLDCQVPDTMDGRFGMVSLMVSLAVMRLEALGEDARPAMAWLTEAFVNDMEAQMREIGVGDVVVGKQVGKLMSALGGRLGALRDRAVDDAGLRETLMRNLYRGESPGDGALDHAVAGLKAFRNRLEGLTVDMLMDGRLAE